MVSTATLAQDDIFKDMDELTTKKTGLIKLTDQEKKELLKWIMASQQKSNEQIEQQVRNEVTEKISQEVREKMTSEMKEEIIKKERKKFMGFTMRESDREIITSNIEGEINGWTGRSIIKLSNGQVWKQVDKKKIRFAKVNNPEVIIKPKSLGSWNLYLKGSNRSIKVKRFK